MANCKSCGVPIVPFRSYCTSRCAQKDPELKRSNLEKRTKTNLLKYGVPNAFQTPEARARISESAKARVKKRGTEHPSFLKFTVDQKLWLQDVDSILHEMRERQISVTSLSEEKGFSRSLLHKRLVRAGVDIPKFCGSEVQRKFADCLPPARYNARVLGTREIDIFFESELVGIEINGLYWHSESRLGRNYHLQKQLEARARGIRLIQFFDSEIHTSAEICRSIAMNAIGANGRKIHARKCKIVPVPAKLARTFLNVNHLQGYAAAKIAYGLEHDGELVSLMTFSSSRFDRTYQFELVRFASLINCSVIGAAGKLFAHFIKCHCPDTIVSFSDNRLFDGSMYGRLGFKEHSQTAPNYWYWRQDAYKLHNRIAFQKHKLPKILPSFDASLTEAENMYAGGWSRVFDCGSTKWVWERPNSPA